MHASDQHEGAGDAASDAPTEVAWHSVRAFVAGLLVLGVSAVLTRGILTWVRKTTPPDVFASQITGWIRLDEIHAALPRITAARTPTTYFIGTSPGMFGFSPRVFDETLRAQSIEMTTYNFATGGNTVANDNLLVRRLGDALEDSGQRASMTILLFVPWQLNPGFQRQSRTPLLKNALLSTVPELARTFLDDPHTAAEMVGLKLLGGIGAAESINLLRARIYKRTPSWWFGAHDKPHVPDELGRLKQLMRKTRRQTLDFDEAVRGEFLQMGSDERVFDRWVELFFATPARLKAEADRIKSQLGTLEDLPIAQDLLDGFIDSVQRSKSFSDHVLVVVMPLNASYVATSDAARRELRAALATVRSRTAVPILDLFDSSEFTADDFQDFSHFKENTGRPKFSRLVATKVADLLRTSARRQLANKETRDGK